MSLITHPYACNFCDKHITEDTRDAWAYHDDVSLSIAHWSTAVRDLAGCGHLCSTKCAIAYVETFLARQLPPDEGQRVIGDDSTHSITTAPQIGCETPRSHERNGPINVTVTTRRKAAVTA